MVPMLLNQAVADKIKEVKRKVLAAIEERNQLEGKGDKVKERSVYWTNFSNKFTYLFDLDEKHFGDLRYHTYHLDADRYEEYFFKEREEVFRKEWDALIADVP